jgi:hypothetical protein
MSVAAPAGNAPKVQTDWSQRNEFIQGAEEHSGVTTTSLVIAPQVTVAGAVADSAFSTANGCPPTEIAYCLEPAALIAV